MTRKGMEDFCDPRFHEKSECTRGVRVRAMTFPDKQVQKNRERKQTQNIKLFEMGRETETKGLAGQENKEKS